jgi:plasmid stabilization system protein ParE
MKPYTVITDPPAEHDIEASYRWGCMVWGVSQAQKWARELRKAINSLSEFPERHPIAPENDQFTEDIRQLIFHRYRILYTIQKKTVHILHVRGAYVADEPDK